MNSIDDAGIDVKITPRSFLKSLGYSDERVNLALRLLQTDACVVSRKALKIVPTGYGCTVEAHPKNVARWNPELRAAIRDAAKEQRALKWAEYRLRRMYSEKRPNSYRCVCPTPSIKNVLFVAGKRLWTAYLMGGDWSEDPTTGKLLPNLYTGTIYVHRDVDLDACTTLEDIIAASEHPVYTFQSLYLEAMANPKI